MENNYFFEFMNKIALILLVCLVITASYGWFSNYSIEFAVSNTGALIGIAFVAIAAHKEKLSRKAVLMAVCGIFITFAFQLAGLIIAS